MWDFENVYIIIFNYTGKFYLFSSWWRGFLGRWREPLWRSMTRNRSGLSTRCRGPTWRRQPPEVRFLLADKRSLVTSLPISRWCISKSIDVPWNIFLKFEVRKFDLTWKKDNLISENIQVPLPHPTPQKFQSPNKSGMGSRNRWGYLELHISEFTLPSKSRVFNWFFLSFQPFSHLLWHLWWWHCPIRQGGAKWTSPLSARPGLIKLWCCWQISCGSILSCGDFSCSSKGVCFLEEL